MAFNDFWCFLEGFWRIFGVFWMFCGGFSVILWCVLQWFLVFLNIMSGGFERAGCLGWF